MKIAKRIFRATVLAVVLLTLVAGVALAYSYYAIIQVQEENGNSYTYLPIVASVDNDYLADNGYIGITGLDTRVLSGSTELKHLVTDDKVLFVAPTVGANSTGNYKYTLDNDDLSSFPVVLGYDGYITVTDDADLELGNDFEIEFDGYVDTSSGSDKNLFIKDYAIRCWVSDDEEITAEIWEDDIFPTVADTESSTSASGTSHAVDLPANIASGNLLLVMFGGTPASVALTTTWPAGWTELFDNQNSTNVQLSAAYKIADGTEGAAITVTTNVNAVAAHQSFRITNYYGIPISGTAATGNSSGADPPNLSPFGGAEVANRWLAIVRCVNNISGYPTNYTDGVSTYDGSDYTGTARRELYAAAENPGVFTLGSSGSWITNTIAIAPPPSLTATVTGISSGVHTVKAYADGTDLGIVVDEGEVGEVSDTTLLSGASVLLNANNIIINQNNVLPYFDYYKHTVSDTLIAWYQPVSMIIGTALDDREGTDAGETGTGEEDGIITWGTNPAGVTATVGSLVSSSQPEISPAEEEGTTDIVPEGGMPSGGTVDVIKLQDNPIYPIVEIAVEYTDLSEEQVWFMLATWVIFVGMVVCVAKVPNHLLLAGTIGLVLSGFAWNMGIYQYWMLLIFGFIWVASLILERKPVF